jgi:hypothetical protein
MPVTSHYHILGPQIVRYLARPDVSIPRKQRLLTVGCKKFEYTPLLALLA